MKKHFFNIHNFNIIILFWCLINTLNEQCYKNILKILVTIHQKSKPFKSATNFKARAAFPAVLICQSHVWVVCCCAGVFDYLLTMENWVKYLQCINISQLMLKNKSESSMRQICQIYTPVITNQWTCTSWQPVHKFNIVVYQKCEWLCGCEEEALLCDVPLGKSTMSCQW